MASVDSLLLVYRGRRPLKGLSQPCGFQTIPVFLKAKPHNSCSGRSFGDPLQMNMLQLDHKFVEGIKDSHDKGLQFYSDIKSSH